MMQETVKVTSVANVDTRQVAYLASDDGLVQISVQTVQGDAGPEFTAGQAYSLQLEQAPDQPAEQPPAGQ